ncbi:nicotinamide riboside transporter PnuC [Filimonas sp.]|nr:nicotinamide riboside transporter PnuC [Filimonas sp.]
MLSSNLLKKNAPGEDKSGDSLLNLTVYLRANSSVINDIVQHIRLQLQATTLVEWFAFFFGVAQVVLALKNKTLNFYAGIISVCLYIYVFYSFGLYAESLLNIYYLIVSIAGIFLWQQKNLQSITFTRSGEWMIAAAIALVSWGLLFFILKQFTPSTVPFLDAIVTATAWAGTWLLIKRKVENWTVLNISNLVAIPLQFYKGLELTSLLTCIYVVIAILGYFQWKRSALEKELAE